MSSSPRQPLWWSSCRLVAWLAASVCSVVQVKAQPHVYREPSSCQAVQRDPHVSCFHTPLHCRLFRKCPASRLLAACLAEEAIPVSTDKL